MSTFSAATRTSPIMLEIYPIEYPRVVWAIVASRFVARFAPKMATLMLAYNLGMHEQKESLFFYLTSALELERFVNSYIY